MTETKQSEGFGVASMVIGIITVIGFIMPYFTLPLSITGFVFGIIQQKRKSTGMATTGIILNVIGFMLAMGIGLLMIFLLTLPVTY